MDIHISQGRKDFINTFLFVVIYGAAFYGVHFFLYASGISNVLPSYQNISNWDAAWYMSVVVHGYQYVDGVQSNPGFFILFPAVWKISHLGYWGICFLNTLFFAAGFSILCSILNVNTQNKILWLSLPSFYFAFLPYSEALFFLLSAIALYGVTKKKLWIIWISLFLLSLTRATCIFLAPAFLAMSLFSDDNKHWLKNLLSYLVTYLLPMVLGTGLFVWYQHLKTGVWFAYFIVQANYWGHKYSDPILPLYNLFGQHTLWINAITVFIDFFCFFFLIYTFSRWLIKNKPGDNLLILSCGYLFMTLLQAIFYSHSNVSSLMRYGLADPFFLVFLYHFTTVARYSWKHYLLIFILCTIVWLSFGAYVHIRYFLFFTTNTVLVLLYMLLSNKKLQWPVLVLTSVNIFFQVYFFQQFISGIYTE